MAVDWDGLLLEPVMDIFGEGRTSAPSTWPTYRASRGSLAVPIRGAVFDAQYQRVIDLGDGMTETSYFPVLGVRDAVFTDAGIELHQGGIVYVPSVAQLFAVKDVQADGHGHTLLILIEAA